MKLNKKHLMIILLVGVLLLVIAIPTGEKTTQTLEGTDIEMRLTNLLNQMQGVGESCVMITYQDKDNVEGVVIVAEGGDNAVVARNITEVVNALFDVDSHKIKVIKGNQVN